MAARRGLSRIVMATLCGVALASATSPGFAKDKYSGFLGDYSRLEKEKDALGAKRLIWIDPQLVPGTCTGILMAPVVLYPAPQASAQVSTEALEEIRAYVDAGVRKGLGAVAPLVDHPGPGVLSVRVAVTGVAIKKGLKPWEIIPVGMIVAGAKEASGSRDRDVDLFVEAEVTDSVTGEPRARVVREAKGVKLEGKKDQLTLEVVKPQLDAWGEAMQKALEKVVKPAQDSMSRVSTDVARISDGDTH